MENLRRLNSKNIGNVNRPTSGHVSLTSQELNEDYLNSVLKYVNKKIDKIFEEMIKAAKNDKKEELSIIKEHYLWKNNAKQLHERDRVILKVIQKIKKGENLSWNDNGIGLVKEPEIDKQGQLYWDNTIEKLIKKFVLLIVENKFLDQYLLCFNEQGEAWYEKLHWYHIDRHFSIGQNKTVNKTLFEKEFYNQFSHDEYNLSPNMKKKYHESYFIWIEDERLFVYLWDRLTQCGFIKYQVEPIKEITEPDSSTKKIEYKIWSELKKHFVIVKFNKNKKDIEFIKPKQLASTLNNINAEEKNIKDDKTKRKKSEIGEYKKIIDIINILKIHNQK